MQRISRSSRRIALDQSYKMSQTYGRQRRSLPDISEHEEQIPIQDGQGNQTNTSLDSVGEEYEYKLPRLHEVVLAGDVEALRQLVSAGADINVCDREGWPPLHTAIRAGNTDCATFLLKQGAGDFYFNKQKEHYEKRLESSRRQPRRRSSYWR